MQKNQKNQPVVKIIPHYLILIFISVIGMAAYYRSLLKGIFLFDDNALIADNPLIKNFSYLKDIFVTHLFQGSGTHSNFYRPVQSLSFMLDYHFWQLNPFGYHFMNILIHILTAMAVYFIFYVLSRKQDIAVITSSLFCVHTVLSWPVNYIASRADLLSAFFMLSAVLSYVLYKKTQPARYNSLLFLSSLIFFIMALLSKEISIILPFVLILYLSCFPEQNKKLKERHPNLIWVFIFVTTLYALLRVTVLDFSKEKLLETTTGMIPMHIRLLTAAKALMIYLKLLVMPTGLHMEWNIEPAVSFVESEVFLSVIGLAVIAGFVYFLFRTSKLKFFAIGWFFITLMPYSNIYPLPYFMGEGWLYIPSIGFFALAAIYLSELRRRSKAWFWTVNLLLVFLLIFYGILTAKRADVWADPVKLYTEILKYSPNNTKARINLGVLLAKSGNDPALEEFRKTVKLDPNDYVAHNNMGIIYKKKGDIAKAMEEYRKALELNPRYPLAYNNIGNIHLESGQYGLAIDFYKKAIDIDPYNANFYNNLGKAYREKKMLKEAREAFEKALKLDPNNKETIAGLDTLK
ncbi:MAG: tetratricopeptide repeat protein [Candidatus Omnitrophota bacterium]|jgi:predicted negative regulator of RcsB-dependent stress response